MLGMEITATMFQQENDPQKQASGCEIQLPYPHRDQPSVEIPGDLAWGLL
jgi:hypothetical protein